MHVKCQLVTGRLRREDHLTQEFKTALDNIARPHIKQRERERERGKG
jgi:hypothetical protein